MKNCIATETEGSPLPDSPSGRSQHRQVAQLSQARKLSSFICYFT